MPERFKLSAPEAVETEIHEACAKFLAACLLPPARWNCFPLGHVSLSPAQLARLQRAGLQAGWPDFLVVFGGLIFGVEIKRKGGVLSKTRTYRTKRGQLRVALGQEETFPQLERAGMKIAVVRSVDDLMAQLTRWGIPYRATPGSRTAVARPAIETGLAGAGPDHLRGVADRADVAGKPGTFRGRARVTG